jgi:hypothetical protein
VSEKIGEDLTPGAVLNHRQPTGEVLPANAKGRDPIVTRIIWLDGTEAQNQNARARGIYIHGTAEESKIGQPVSWGCVRMRSKDVIEVFEQVPVGTTVNIITEKLPRIAKYTPPKPVKPPVLVAAHVPAKPPVAPVPTPAAKPPVVAAAPPASKVVASATPTPSPKVVASAPPKPAPKIAAAPTPAPAKKLAQLPPPPPANPTPVSAPAPLVAEHRPELSINSAASQAMKGSMLMAGLPDGPSSFTTRSAPTAQPPARPFALSISAEPAATTESEKRAARLAFRNSASDTKAKP